MQYSMSFNEETYNERFDTIEEAVAEAASQCDEYETSRFWIGEIVAPRQPEEMFDVSDFLYRVSEDDTYTGDWAADWDRSTQEQKAELEASVKSACAHRSGTSASRGDTTWSTESQCYLRRSN